MIKSNLTEVYMLEFSSTKQTFSLKELQIRLYCEKYCNSIHMYTRFQKHRNLKIYIKYTHFFFFH